MPRGHCHRHGEGRPCSCSMGNLYRFVEPVVLYMLKKEGRAYGNALCAALGNHALTDSLVDRSALYRTLRVLEENGFVTSEWDVTGGGPAKHLYQLTDAGEEHLREWAVVLDSLSTTMSAFVEKVRAVVGEGEEEPRE